MLDLLNAMPAFKGLPCPLYVLYDLADRRHESNYHFLPGCAVFDDKIVQVDLAIFMKGISQQLQHQSQGVTLRTRIKSMLMEIFDFVPTSFTLLMYKHIAFQLQH